MVFFFEVRPLALCSFLTFRAAPVLIAYKFAGPIYAARRPVRHSTFDLVSYQIQIALQP